MWLQIITAPVVGLLILFVYRWIECETYWTLTIDKGWTQKKAERWCKCFAGFLWALLLIGWLELGDFF